jgi:hypothetical protein
MQKFHDTTGYLYAVRFWRLVIYVDNRAASLRFGGIVTSIGLARFVFWRFSWVEPRPTPVAADGAVCSICGENPATESGNMCKECYPF